jgi:hypothetical protein
VQNRLRFWLRSMDYFAKQSSAGLLVEKSCWWSTFGSKRTRYRDLLME